MKNFKNPFILLVVLLLCDLNFAAAASSAATVSDKQCSEFYRDYLTKYYPRAFVFREKYWNGETPEKIAEELKDIVQVLTQQPWFYVSNTPKNFDLGHYWEFIVDQTSIVSSFLRRAQVDLKTKKVFLKKSNSFYNDYNLDASGDYGDSGNYGFGGLLEDSNSKSATQEKLFTYWKRTQQNSYYDFYAMTFDYIVKLFNEGILYKDLKQARRYYQDLDFVLQQLQGSDYEAVYHEAFKTCHELQSRLEHLVTSVDKPLGSQYDDLANNWDPSSSQDDYAGVDVNSLINTPKANSTKALDVDNIQSDSANSRDVEFLESFIKYYEFSPEGRYTHEYHPLILKRTAESFDVLENQLRVSGFDLDGRILIMGYEENAVPFYYTSYKKARINDEARLKVKAGWAERLSNRFGFMTGFLFKNIKNNICSDHNDFVLEHIDSDTIPLFNDRAVIFQEHAFGEALDLMQQGSLNIEQRCEQKDFNGVLRELIVFWNLLYSKALKIGNNQVAGTQDVLFSIEYAKHLMRSNLPYLKYFVGPDITYPIEVSSKQEKEATLHAQKFIQILTRELNPVKDEPTVYIFCSFVDGVGKSTMLGNIKNWMQSGDDVDKFEHVDNSSSQLAALFEFKDNVFIADMPAQISHFTYKPDGLVYVDAKTEFSAEQIKKQQAFVAENALALELEYKKTINRLQQIAQTKGVQSIYLSKTQSMGENFIANIILLKKQDLNSWIPFGYEGQNYLFNYKQPTQLRYLVSLALVKSEGLKNIESDQMLFFEGIRFPYTYQYFLSDLVARLQDHKIKHIVFVDFTSMYPRSSRENIRINYLLQQMALLEQSFSYRFSLYKEFVSGGELLSCLLDKSSATQVVKNFKLETDLRLALFKLLEDRKQGDLTGWKVEDLTTMLRQQIDTMSPQLCKTSQRLTNNKIQQEARNMESVYGLSKSFVNIQQFSFTYLAEFSNLLSDLFSKQITSDTLNFLWNDPGVPCIDGAENGVGLLKQPVLTTNGDLLFAYYCLEPECRDQAMLEPFVRMLRANWYASISNWFYSIKDQNHALHLDSERVFVDPLFVKFGVDNKVYLVQKILENWTDKVPQNVKKTLFDFRLNGLNSAAAYGSFVNQPYRVDWSNIGTEQGIFAYNSTFNDKNSERYTGEVVNKILQTYRKNKTSDSVITTTELYERLKKHPWWKGDNQWLLDSAKKNGVFDKNTENLNKKEDKGASWSRVSKVKLGSNEIRSAVKRMVRLLAMLEMIAKDPEANIVVRPGCKSDFKSALMLIENLILPYYFGVIFEEPLFKDYDKVGPYPSWDHWERLGLPVR